MGELRSRIRKRFAPHAGKSDLAGELRPEHERHAKSPRTATVLRAARHHRWAGDVRL